MNDLYLVLLLTIVGGLTGGAVASMVVYFHLPLIKAKVWEDAYGTGVADAWQSMDYDGGKTPAARLNPYRDWRTRLPLSWRQLKVERKAKRAFNRAFVGRKTWWPTVKR